MTLNMIGGDTMDMWSNFEVAIVVFSVSVPLLLIGIFFLWMWIDFKMMDRQNRRAGANIVRFFRKRGFENVSEVYYYASLSPTAVMCYDCRRTYSDYVRTTSRDGLFGHHNEDLSSCSSCRTIEG